MKQSLAFNQALKMHEKLAASYNSLAAYTKDVQKVLAYVSQKVRRPSFTLP